MPAFLKVRRNQLIIGGVLVLLLVLLGLFLFLPRNQTTSNTTASGSATVSPSPSPDISPSPSPSASPSPSSAGVPSPGAPTIGPQGAVLRAGPAPDDNATLFGASGGGCAIWVHPGWTQDDCGLIQVSGTDASGTVAYVVEHKTATGGRRVSLMTASGSYWLVKLHFSDETGSFIAISVRGADITGDGQKEVLVGIRAVGTNHVLNLDGVRRTSTSDPLVIIHRELVNGKATISGGLTDYSAAGGGYTKTVIMYGGSTFHGTSSTVATAPSGDFA
ncbi:MAG TPA: hypothetical protein VG329_03875 [Candidatus Dormibacteraeota bacterium]|nr:hypothetical protein [Candidatus Dormibacteraeota bacterium]